MLVYLPYPNIPAGSIQQQKFLMSSQMTCCMYIQLRKQNNESLKSKRKNVRGIFMVPYSSVS